MKRLFILVAVLVASCQPLVYAQTNVEDGLMLRMWHTTENDLYDFFKSNEVNIGVATYRDISTELTYATYFQLPIHHFKYCNLNLGCTIPIECANRLRPEFSLTTSPRKFHTNLPKWISAEVGVCINWSGYIKDEPIKAINLQLGLIRIAW